MQCNRGMFGFKQNISEALGLSNLFRKIIEYLLNNIRNNGSWCLVGDAGWPFHSPIHVCTEVSSVPLFVGYSILVDILENTGLF